MRIAGLFAGVGGLEHGLAMAGHETAFLCEVWAPAAAVLRAHHPAAPLHGDIADLDALPGGIDLVTAGFPCQDLSQAGATAGIAGRKTGLVGHVFRLLDASDAPMVLLENVSFMLRLDRGRAMAVLAEALEARGFRWAYRTINTLGFLPQRRERVFMLASRSDLDPADVLFAEEAFPVDTPTDLDARAHGFYWTEGVRGLGWAADAVPTLKNGSTVGIASPPAILLPSGQVIKPDIRDAERLQGFPIDWTSPAATVARPSIRWSLVGNAVSVPVAQWIGAMLAAPGRHRPTRETRLLDGQPWPRAARFDGRARASVQISDFPVWRPRSPLAEFLLYPGEPLSARATRGFLGRTEVAKLRFPEGFLDRLRRHLAVVESEAARAELAA